MKSNIYKVTSKTSGKSYIGKTIKSILKRFDEHVWHSLNENCLKTHFHNAIKKYGKGDFIIELLECAENTLASEREIYWIDYFDTFNGEGYNMTVGGEGFGIGENHPMYNSARFGELNPFFGKEHSEEAKKKISDEAKGLVVARNKVTGEVTKILKEEFDLNNNLVGITNGIKLPKSHRDNISKSTIGKSKPRVICDLCGLSIDTSNLKRHKNGKNCKKETQ